jgi:hypothetical protein
LGFWEAFKVVESALDAIDDKHFAYYNLTKYFLAYAVVSLIRTDPTGVATLQNMEKIISSNKLQALRAVFENLSKSLALDLNAEVVGDTTDNFDYKNELKSPSWCKKMAAKLVAQYSKDVMRKKADSIAVLCADLAPAP